MANMSDYKAYVYALSEQLAQHQDSLASISELISQRPLSFIERTATERSLQIVIEAAIGASKHYLKSVNKPMPAEARASIERVYELEAITEPKIEEMRGAVGMRNAIIHDYLNLDWNKLEAVLKEKKYENVVAYTKVILNKILEKSS
jgi:uncharacterized protein YutE (UPF0331/DUF86 family)